MYNAKEKDKLRADYKRSVLHRYKVMKGCNRCGYNENALALEFNHINPKSKHKTLGSLMYHSWEKIKHEINKCEILCANCHQIETLSQSSPTRQRRRQ